MEVEWDAGHGCSLKISSHKTLIDYKDENCDWMWRNLADPRLPTWSRLRSPTAGLVNITGPLRQCCEKGKHHACIFLTRMRVWAPSWGNQAKLHPTKWKACTLYNFSRREDRKKLRNCSRLKEAKKNVTIKCKVLSWTKQERDIVGIVEIWIGSLDPDVSVITADFWFPDLEVVCCLRRRVSLVWENVRGRSWEFEASCCKYIYFSICLCLYFK